jgi:hypothetical protein
MWRVAGSQRTFHPPCHESAARMVDSAARGMRLTVSAMCRVRQDLLDSEHVWLFGKQDDPCRIPDATEAIDDATAA